MHCAREPGARGFESLLLGATQHTHAHVHPTEHARIDDTNLYDMHAFTPLALWHGMAWQARA